MKLIQSVASLKNLQHNFLKMRGEGGSKAVWNFSENSSVLDGVGFPNGLIEGNPLQKRFLTLVFKG